MPYKHDADEIIELCMAFKRGEKLERIRRNDPKANWNPCPKVCNLNLGRYEYRIKPDPMAKTIRLTAADFNQQRIDYDEWKRKINQPIIYETSYENRGIAATFRRKLGGWFKSRGLQD